MRAPLDLQNHVMRRDSSFIPLFADALVNQALHALDELGSGESAAGVDGATEPAIDDAAHSFKDATQEAFRQCFLALLLYNLFRIVSVSHELAIRAFSSVGQDAVYPKSHKEAQNTVTV